MPDALLKEIDVAKDKHGLFSGDAPTVIMESQIAEVIVTNTVPVENKINICPKIKVVDISPVLAEAVRRIHNGESMSYLSDVS